MNWLHEKDPAGTGSISGDTHIFMYIFRVKYMISSGAAKVKKNGQFCGIFYPDTDIKVRG